MMPQKMDDIDKTMTVIEGVGAAGAMTLEVMGARTFHMGNRYTRTSWLGQVFIYLNFPILLFAGPVILGNHPILFLMMLMLAGGTVLRFGLHSRWVRRHLEQLIRAVLREVCTLVQKYTSWDVMRFSHWSAPEPPNSYYWGHSWLQRLVGFFIPGVRQYEDAETGELKGMMPITFQFFIEPPLIFVLGWLVIGLGDFLAGAWLIFGAMGLVIVGRHRRKAILDYEQDIEDLVSQREGEEELLRRVMQRRQRDADADDGLDIGNVAGL